MSKTLSFALVSLAGSIDRAQSLASAEAALDAHIAEHETQQETVAEAVNAVFDQYRGENLTMPILEGLALQKMNAIPANYKVLGKLALDFVRSNSDQKGEADRTRTFGISKGKGGGVCRWSDVPVETADTDSK